MILVFYAFAREVGPFKRRLKSRRALDSRELRGFRGEVRGREIVAIAAGIGMAQARESARRAFESYPETELAIGTGVAGALVEELRPGAIVIADRVIVHRGAKEQPEHLGAFDTGHARKFGRRLAAEGLPYSCGAIFTSHAALANGGEKRRAGEATGAIAVDMETAAIAEEARLRGIPFVCLRAIIDELDDEVIGPKLDRQGNIRPIATASHAIRNPRKLAGLPRMMRNLGLATRTLADALEAVVIEQTGETS